MSESEDPQEQIQRRLREQVEHGALRLTIHAQQEMVEEEILLDDMLGALRAASLLENYPEHKRGACCLVCGYTVQGRALHVVCTTTLPILIVITVYEPLPPKWVTPVQRAEKP